MHMQSLQKSCFSLSNMQICGFFCWSSLLTLLIQVQEAKVFTRSCVFFNHFCLRGSKRALIQQLPEHHKFACLPKAFIFAYFTADLELSTTWTGQYCSCVRIHGHILKTQWFWMQTKWLLKCDVKFSGRILWYSMWSTLSMLRLPIATKKTKAVKNNVQEERNLPWGRNSHRNWHPSRQRHGGHVRST